MDQTQAKILDGMMRFTAFPVLVMQSLVFMVIGVINCGWVSAFWPAKTPTQQISGNIMLLLTLGLIACAILLIKKPLHQLVPYILILSVAELLSLIFILGENTTNAIGWAVYFLSLVFLVIGAWFSRRIGPA